MGRSMEWTKNLSQGEKEIVRLGVGAEEVCCIDDGTSRAAMCLGMATEINPNRKCKLYRIPLNGSSFLSRFGICFKSQEHCGGYLNHFDHSPGDLPHLVVELFATEGLYRFKLLIIKYIPTGPKIMGGGVYDVLEANAKADGLKFRSREVVSTVVLPHFEDPVGDMGVSKFPKDTIRNSPISYQWQNAISRDLISRDPTFKVLEDANFGRPQFDITNTSLASLNLPCQIKINTADCVECTSKWVNGNGVGSMCTDVKASLGLKVDGSYVGDREPQKIVPNTKFTNAFIRTTVPGQNQARRHLTSSIHEHCFIIFSMD
ncbi:uncharacterized protein BDR25DRAFT_350808 [Lindgomyces ingoldianus]|uniref:Uncharacterized protein n=1 Tax=Lindgomyces ingoldianus TaxID=673940 RepID=A0ACB6RAQ6_9PLEO|nr:uncharacterized protein BDR25DRAFT_350808 [Lindgomyces ingoldianus]KAF2475430.1 hypothetical protein BDR25DRAFT_350808 [Lindgomyces ingoldianus]